MLKTLMVSLAVATSLGCASTNRESNRRTAGEVIDDVTIQADVNAAIVGDEDASFFKIKVTSHKGDVVLHGFVNTREAEVRLIARVSRLRGVNSVKSLLHIEQPRT